MMVFGAIVTGLLTLAMVAVLPAAPARAALSPSGFERCLLDRINDSRAAVGAPPLRMASDLVAPVRAWSEWMRFNEFEHMPSSRRQDILPPSWTRWGENIAHHSSQSLSDCSTIHSMFMNSAPHRASILNPLYRYVALGTYVDGSGWWVTELFFDASNYEVPCNGSCDDEIFFYRHDGIYRYYDIRYDGTIGLPISGGDGYTSGWSSITAIDLDGDGADEMFFYRDDGIYRYYDLRPDGTIGSPIRAGDGYTRGWSSITAIDLDGDGADEILFYRDDGLYRYYNISGDGTIGSPIRSGTQYTTGWSSITAVSLD